MAHAHCMLDDKGYKHSLRIRLCSSYCFATTTIDARTRTKRYVIRTLSVMLCLLYSKVTDWPRRTVADFRLCVGHDCLGAHLHHIAIRPDPYCTLCRLHEPMERSLGSVGSRTQLCHWGVTLVIMYWETTTCFGPWWPSSGCLGST